MKTNPIDLIELLDKTLIEGQDKINDLETFYANHIKSLQEYLNIFIERKNHFKKQRLKGVGAKHLNDDIRDWLNKAIIWKAMGNDIKKS